MRVFTSLAALALLAVATAIPITPAAPELQRRAEEMRSMGMAEVRSSLYTHTPSIPPY